MRARNPKGGDAANGARGDRRAGDRRPGESSATNATVPAGALAGATMEARAPRYIIKPLASLQSKVLKVGWLGAAPVWPRMRSWF